MFVDNLNPVLMQFGPFQIRYYGIVYVIGFLLVYYVLYQSAKKKTIKNLTEEKADSLMLYIIISLIIGARVFEFIAFEPGVLRSHPLEIFYIWHGGMSFHGALIGLIFATYLFGRKYNIRFYQLADILVFPAIIALFLGRIANFINGELWGTPTAVPWCVVFPRADNLCRHPSQLYEALKNIIIFFALLFMATKKKWKEGTIFWTFILMYGTFRFIINFWRDDPALLFGISTGQWLSILMVPIALYFLIRINKER